MLQILSTNGWSMYPWEMRGRQDLPLMKPTFSTFSRGLDDVQWMQELNKLEGKLAELSCKLELEKK